MENGNFNCRYRKKIIVVDQLMIMFVLISGCASSGSRLPVISDSEAFKYEKDFRNHNSIFFNFYKC